MKGGTGGNTTADPGEAGRFIPSKGRYSELYGFLLK